MPTSNEDLLDQAITHQVELQAFSAQQARRLVRLLDRLERDLRRQLATISTEFNRARVEALLSQVRRLASALGQDLFEATEGEVRRLARFEAALAVAQIEGATFGLVPVTTPNLDTLAGAALARPFHGRLLREWYRDLAEGLRHAVSDQVRIGFGEGESIQQITRRVLGTTTRPGALGRSRRDVEAIVRTAVNHTSTFARARVYERNADLISEEQWVSTLDNRTTPICRANDGKRFPVGEGPRPPAHIGCRSTTVPIVKSWRGLDLRGLTPQTRASMDGQVPARLSYGDWLRTKPREFVVEVMGKRKAQLFLDGNLSVRRFVSRQGFEYTLDDLRRLHPEAWQRAGLTP